MRISCVIQSLGPGGSERQMVNLVKGLTQKGNQCQLILFSKKIHYRPELENLPIVVKSIQISSETGYLNFHLKLIKEATKRISLFRPNIIQSFLPLPNLVSALCGKLTKIPVIISERNVDTPMTNLGRWLRIFFYRFSNLMTCNSEAVKEWSNRFYRFPLEKIQVVPNGIDLKKFSGMRNLSPSGTSPRTSSGTSSGTYLILTVASFKPQKGHKYLLAALPGIIRNFPQVRCIFLGEGGGQKAELEKLVKSLNLSEFVSFKEKVGNLENFYQEATVFCLPSLAEGMPNAVMEAMAHGLPVVATKVGGNQELVVNNHTGFLVPPIDPTSLTLAINRLLENPILRRTFGENAKEHTVRFTEILPELFLDSERIFE
ncbi:glycosyltransferase [bacterium]|nr:glycosyltransferase [bacterium]